MHGAPPGPGHGEAAASTRPAELAELAELAEALCAARAVLVLTGAGLSADSGMPTYRGVGGLYEAQHTEEGYAIEDALSIGMLHARPEVCWRYLRQIDEASGQAAPNAGHEALAALEQALPGMWTLTQNVDGLHARAGSQRLIEMHGRRGDLYCMDCAAPMAAAQARAFVQALATLPPRCACGGVLRPRVVLFGEMLPEAAIAQYTQVLEAEPEVVIAVGTSAVFPYIQAPLLEARGRGALAVDINPGASDISGAVHWHWRERAAVALPRLAQAVAARQAGG